MATSENSPTPIQEAHRSLLESIQSSIYPDITTGIKAVHGLAPGEDVELSLIKAGSEGLTSEQKALASISNCLVYQVGDSFLTSQTNSRGVGLSYLVNGGSFHQIREYGRVFDRFDLDAIFAQTQNGVVDLARIYPQDVRLTLEANGYFNRFVPSLNESVLIPMHGSSGDPNWGIGKGRGEVQVEMVLHEAGHTWVKALDLMDFKGSDNFSLALANAVQAFFPKNYQLFSKLFDNERNKAALMHLGRAERLPSAIALLLHKNYSANGINLTPGISDIKELFEIYEADLAQYEIRKFGAVPRGTQAFMSRWYKRELLERQEKKLEE